MLAANFQSFKVSLVTLCTVPAVLLGSLALLMLTGSTLNLQSYMGMIMSVGVSISNSVLLVTNAEQLRMHSGNALGAARESAAVRLRPILMTSVAMVVGMVPMALPECIRNCSALVTSNTELEIDTPTDMIMPIYD